MYMCIYVCLEYMYNKYGSEIELDFEFSDDHQDASMLT